MIKVDRLFTSEGQDVYEGVEWEIRDAEIKKPADGEIVFEQRGVEFPVGWSTRASNIVASKYFYGLGDERETSLMQLISRVVKKITDHGVYVASYFEDDDARAFADELTFILLHQIAAFNSPVWFNIGLPGVRQQASACFINHLEDSMESIMELATAEAQIFKRGSGAGVNISALRGKGENLSGGGTSSGPLSFMKGFDAFAGVIKSGGVTRRAAKMVIMDDDHPDILDFIQSKGEEEKKAHVLIDAGYDDAIDGEAYGSVFFQNANHSVRLSDEFMEAAQSPNDSWELVGRRDDTEPVIIGASDMFDELAETAWRCGDPGVHFSDTINAWNMAADIEPIRASNPCSEFVFLDNTACNLASINVVKFMDADGFSLPQYKHTIRILILAMEILCDLADYPTEAIARRTAETRPLGLGICNLGDMLMRLGVPYDSETARKQAAVLMDTLTCTAYHQSARIANAVGPCDAWEQTSASAMSVLGMHTLVAATPALEEEWNQTWATAKEYGLRNLQVSVCAPTGTISFMMDCGSTGIEPLMGLTSTKTLVGGGTVEFTPDCVAVAFKERTSDLSDPVFQTAFGDNPLSWQAHVKMLGALSPHISGAISKTVNMPADATVQDVKDAYIMAHKLGVKCLAIYRDGCKKSQPVNVKKKSDPVVVVPAVLGQRRHLPSERVAITHKFRLGGHNVYITVGMYEDGTPGEVFVRMASEGSTASGAFDAWAKAISFLLQKGTSVSFIEKKFKNSAYEPHGFTGNPEIPSAKSITDYVVRWMGMRFGDLVPDTQGEIGFIPTSPITRVTAAQTQAIGLIDLTFADAPIQTTTASCSFCCGITQPSGSCSVCVDCGATTGCG